MTLLVGSSETGYSTATILPAGRAAGFAFAALETGLLEELQFRTNGTANTGVTSVRLAVFAEEAGVARPVRPIQEGVYVGTPGVNSWLSVSGLQIPILKGGQYWLAVMPIGGSLHFGVQGSGGSPWTEATEAGSELWQAYIAVWGAPVSEGPAGFQGLGTAGVGTNRAITFGINGGVVDNGHAPEWIRNKVVAARGWTGRPEYPRLIFAYNELEAPANAVREVKKALAEQIKTPIVLILGALVSEPKEEPLLSTLTPSAYADGAVAIIQAVVAECPTVTTFELFNEPWACGPHGGSNASDYANLVLAAYKKAHESGVSGVTMLVAAFGEYQKVNAAGEKITEDWSRVNEGNGWLGDLLAAQPELKEGEPYAVHGWTSHPYGGAVEIGHEAHSGFLSAVSQREEVRRHGGAGYNNWWITEVGFQVTEPPTAVEKDQQSASLKQDLETAQLLGVAGWLKCLTVYCDGETELEAGKRTFNVYGWPAGTMYATFAYEYGLAGVEFSAHFAAAATLVAPVTTPHPWSGATNKWEQDMFPWSEASSKTPY